VERCDRLSHDPESPFAQGAADDGDEGDIAAVTDAFGVAMAVDMDPITAILLGDTAGDIRLSQRLDATGLAGSKTTKPTLSVMSNERFCQVNRKLRVVRIRSSQSSRACVPTPDEEGANSSPLRRAKAVAAASLVLTILPELLEELVAGGVPKVSLMTLKRSTSIRHSAYSGCRPRAGGDCAPRMRFEGRAILKPGQRIALLEEFQASLAALGLRHVLDEQQPKTSPSKRQGPRQTHRELLDRRAHADEVMHARSAAGNRRSDAPGSSASRRSGISISIGSPRSLRRGARRGSRRPG
jgi:hypothetical protein